MEQEVRKNKRQSNLCRASGYFICPDSELKSVSLTEAIMCLDPKCLQKEKSKKQAHSCPQFLKKKLLMQLIC